MLGRLEKEAYAMASKLYESAGAGGAAPGADGADGADGPKPNADKKKGDVIDAEFEETN